MELLTKASFSGDANEREKRNLEVAYQAACESVVLLKNNGALPFKDKIIAVYGAGASRTIKGGTGSGEVNERASVSILDGLKDRDFRVTTKGWIKDFETQYEKAYAKYQKKKVNPLHLSGMFAPFHMPEGRKINKKDISSSGTENCVYVLSRQAGEGGDRRAEKGDYYLTDIEIQNIQFCAKNYKNFVLIINCGSSVDLSVLDNTPEINAILYISQLGCQGGNAVADILSGAVSPSGKLADSWAKAYTDLPFANEYSYLNGELGEEYYKEGIYVGYRYFDSFGVEPRFPFGFGLGYSNFKLGESRVTVEGSRVTLRVTVKNAGRKYAGKETVQLYVSPPAGKLDKEYQRLVAFSKSALLAPGKSQELELSFDMAALASFRFDGACSVLEPGDYVLRLGSSSRDTVAAAVLRLDREVITAKHLHICPLPERFPELEAAPSKPEQLASHVPVIKIDAGCIPTKIYEEHPPALCDDSRVRNFVDRLSLKDMAEIVVGVGMFGGKTRFTLPGSVGNTTSKFWDKGLANATLCDGPAGLRIQQRSTVSSDGKVKAVGQVLSALEALPKPIKDRMQGDPEKEPVIYQYTTAFPVASALAQSWNEELLYEIGGAVFDEMKEYGCTFWLAPAINIHRNPLCGRNFEYFSEDPFLCGALASALTRGVQREEGYYVTVKHFACNNQEDNRNKVSSNVSERALREIYLPAFEQVVRRGGAKAVMTSYNRLNGVYTPTSYDLCTKLLRIEWGFEGVVMTDWFSTMFGKNSSALAIAAGNDLIMPGEPLSKRSIVRSVKKGLIQEDDLRRCCCNVVKAVMDSAIQKEYIG